MSGETITISKKAYDRLMKAERMLNCLKECGVDNWEGFAEAAQLNADLESETDDQAQKDESTK